MNNLALVVLSIMTIVTFEFSSFFASIGQFNEIISNLLPHTGVKSS